MSLAYLFVPVGNQEQKHRSQVYMDSSLGYRPAEATPGVQNHPKTPNQRVHPDDYGDYGITTI